MLCICRFVILIGVSVFVMPMATGANGDSRKASRDGKQVAPIKPIRRATIGLHLEQGDRKYCARIRKIIDSKPGCRKFDEKLDEGCEEDVPVEGNNLYWAPTKIEVMNGPLFGYTRLFRTEPDVRSNQVIVYVDKFRGDNVPRKLETWKIAAAPLESILMKYSKRLEMNLQDKTGMAEGAIEFEHLLSQSEKISNEMSPGFFVDEQRHLVIRSCKGKWVFGGYYSCEAVVRLRVLKIADDVAPVAVCQFSRLLKARKRQHRCKLCSLRPAKKPPARASAGGFFYGWIFVSLEADGKRLGIAGTESPFEPGGREFLFTRRNNLASNTGASCLNYVCNS